MDEKQVTYIDDGDDTDDQHDPTCEFNQLVNRITPMLKQTHTGDNQNQAGQVQITNLQESYSQSLSEENEADAEIRRIENMHKETTKDKHSHKEI